jgi:BACON domain-containing protein/all-beta uncharacterized protein
MALRHAGLFVALMIVLDVRAAEAQCSFSVSPTSISVPSFGTTSSLSVITGSSCTYGATSPDAWITITSVTGKGLGQVNFTVAANTTGATRVGTIVAAGVTVTVTQSASSCTASVTPSAISAPLTSNVYGISVTTGSSCAWTASSAVSWITLTGSTSGTGIGSVNITVAATTTARTGTLTVAGQTVTVTQGGGGGGGASPPAPPTNLRIIK